MADVRISFPDGVRAGSINLPVSKSVVNRQLVLDALQGNPLRTFEGEPEDVRILREALKSSTSGQEIHLKHAGTAMRFATAYFAIKDGAYVVLTGSSRLRERPLTKLVEALSDLGATVNYLDEAGFLPIAVYGNPLQGKAVHVDVSESSQFASALMLIAPKVKGGLTIHFNGVLVSKPYVDMTVALLRANGASVDVLENGVQVFSGFDGGTGAEPELDWSSAAFFYSLVALSEDGAIFFPKLSLHSVQGDSRAAELFEQLGVKTEATEVGIRIFKVERHVSSLSPVNFLATPDLAQPFISTCAGLGVAVRVVGLQTLNLKESERITTLGTCLKEMGAKVRYSSEVFEVLSGVSHKATKSLNTFNDHRLAMCLAPLALKFPGLMLSDAGVVKKSFPNFWDALSELGASLRFTD